tara:strand:+ start:19898 stop:20758 length:861 start_codon:yes stop_codon:yes gene_type:complete
MSQGFINAQNITLPLAVTNGGTGLVSTTINQLLYSSSTNTIAGLATVNSATLTTNSSGVPGWTASSATLPTIQKFTSGSGTYTTPAGVKYIAIQMVGGGGGGGGSSSAFNGGTGGTGGSTTFGSSLLTCTGGAGGTGLNPSVGGAGGTATIGAGATGLNISGQSGNGGMGTGPLIVYNVSGGGGNTPFSGAGTAVTMAAGTSIGKTAVTNTGSGGGGASYSGGGVGNSFTGAGGGAAGYIQAIINTPAATYSYTVGTAGTAGIAGTAGSAGGAGAAGIIIVYEYYN